jgi:hypothetical protein
MDVRQGEEEPSSYSPKEQDENDDIEDDLAAAKFNVGSFFTTIISNQLEQLTRSSTSVHAKASSFSVGLVKELTQREANETLKDFSEENLKALLQGTLDRYSVSAAIIPQAFTLFELDVPEPPTCKGEAAKHLWYQKFAESFVTRYFDHIVGVRESEVTIKSISVAK